MAGLVFDPLVIRGTPTLTVTEPIVITGETRLPFWDPYGGGELFSAQTAWSAWDVVWLAGKPLPGLGSVKGSAVQRVEVQKVNGENGGALIERGYTPGTLDIDLVMWLPKQWSDLQKLMPSIYQRSDRLDIKASAAAAKKQSAAKQEIEIKAAERRSLSIDHPGAAFLGIVTVIIEQVTLPVDGPVPGSKSVTFKCIEYVPRTGRTQVGNVKGKTVGEVPVNAVYKNKLPPPSQQAHAADPGVELLPEPDQGGD